MAAGLYWQFKEFRYVFEFMMLNYVGNSKNLDYDGSWIILAIQRIHDGSWIILAIQRI